MRVACGLAVVALSLACWAGQVIAWFAPATGARLGLAEGQDDVEPAFYADARGEALWDALTLWTMVVAGLLLAADRPSWAYFGLAGGATYVYFAGRGIMARRESTRRGLRVAAPGALRGIYAALAIWGLMGAISVAASIAALESA